MTTKFSNRVNTNGYRTHTVEALASRHDARYLLLLCDGIGQSHLVHILPSLSACWVFISSKRKEMHPTSSLQIFVKQNAESHSQSFLSDVFMPKCRVLRNKFRHDLNTRCRVQYGHLYIICIEESKMLFQKLKVDRNLQIKMVINRSDIYKRVRDM